MKFQCQIFTSLQTSAVRTLMSVVSVSLAIAMLESCKPLTKDSVSEVATAEEQKTEFEILTANQNTSLKTSLLQSDGLSGAPSCPIPQGTILTAESIKAEGVGHWRVFLLMEVKLPNGEVGRTARQGEPSEQTVASPAPANPSTDSAVQSAAIPPVASPSSEVKEVVKTPAQLLNCDMLNSGSFLVYNSHFSRQKVLTRVASASPSSPSSPAVQESLGADDGLFSWPTRGRKIRNDAGGSGYFGAPRASGRGHQGIDIVAAVGEPIYAARAGTIIDPSFERAYGNVVDVKHSEGYLSRYAHLTSFSYSHGAYVEKGARIAVSGRTGNAVGSGITPHLHFEIRRDGRLLNPVTMLP